VRRWQRSGVDVTGIEIDHDCPTSQLAAYAAWLAREKQQVPAPLTLGITALPTWRNAPTALRALGVVVDDVTLQVHAVHAPSLFESAQALRDVRGFVRAIDRHINVALPAYSAALNGQRITADVDDVARTLAALNHIDAVQRVVFFRLGAADDAGAWSTTTLRALVQGEPLVADVHASLRTGSDGALDVVLENRGVVEADAPARIGLHGDVQAGEGLRGYTLADHALVTGNFARIRPGDIVVVGWVRGSIITVDEEVTHASR
jgi:hypothetical protein